jgi:hypothetical protein
MAASLSKHEDDKDDDDTSVSAAYDWGHEFHRRDQQQWQHPPPMPAKGSGCWYLVLWVGFSLAVVVATLVLGLAGRGSVTNQAHTVWNQPVYHEHSLSQWSSTTMASPHNSMPCFFSFPDIEQVEHQALHCRGDNAVRIPCPAHGHCSNGTLQHCQAKHDNGKLEGNVDQYWQVSPSGTACIWTPRVLHQVQFWKNALTEESIQSLCMPRITRSVAAWDPATGRPLFNPSALADAGWSYNYGPMEDAKFWSMVAANGPDGQDPIFVVRQSFAVYGVTAGPTSLVGLHSSQPLELPLACRVRHGWVRVRDTTWKPLVPGLMVALVALFAVWLLSGSQSLLGTSK